MWSGGGLQALGRGGLGCGEARGGGDGGSRVSRDLRELFRFAGVFRGVRWSGGGERGARYFSGKDGGGLEARSGGGETVRSASQRAGQPAAVRAAMSRSETVSLSSEVFKGNSNLR